MASGLSSSGSDSFPPTFLVLSVDDDLDSLIALEKMLLQCSCQGTLPKFRYLLKNSLEIECFKYSGHKILTKCQCAEDALSLLRENNSQFDILLTEIQMPEMNGFQLLVETLKLHINLPVILFSADLDQDMVKKGINSGASLVLSKPISMDILKVIWQLAYCNKRKIESGRGGSVALVVPIKGIEEEQDDNLRRGGQEEPYKNYPNSTVAAIEMSKPRFLWTEECHNIFVEALEFLGVDNCLPAKILEYMQMRQENCYLTPRVISSHLQKHRRKKAAKQGASYDKDSSSEAPYSRDTIKHPSSEIPPMRYTGKPSPCNSIKMPTTSNIPPAVSSGQSTYLDRGTMCKECCQMNEHELNHDLDLNVPPPSNEL